MAYGFPTVGAVVLSIFVLAGVRIYVYRHYLPAATSVSGGGGRT